MAADPEDAAHDLGVLDGHAQSCSPPSAGCFPGPGTPGGHTEAATPGHSGSPHTRRAAALTTGIQEAGCSSQKAPRGGEQS